MVTAMNVGPARRAGRAAAIHRRRQVGAATEERWPNRPAIDRAGEGLRVGDPLLPIAVGVDRGDVCQGVVSVKEHVVHGNEPPGEADCRHVEAASPHLILDELALWPRQRTRPLSRLMKLLCVKIEPAYSRV
jgi:hypothetical protein